MQQCPFRQYLYISQHFCVLSLVLVKTPDQDYYNLITVSWYVEFWPETTAVVRHCLGVTVELTHREGIVGHQVVAGRELVQALGGVGRRHPLHLIHLHRHAGGFVGGQTGPVLVRSGDGADIGNIINILQETTILSPTMDHEW